MDIFAGKSASERNKMIAAATLGVVALLALYMAFGRGMFSSSPAITVKATPSPRPTSQANRPDRDVKLPSIEQQDFAYATTPISYSGSLYQAPEPGRNIFAFYEPPKPCRGDCPTPTPTPVQIKTPPPTPPPPMTVTFVTPQTIYAGSGAFRLEVNGEKFDPASRIYFNQSELPTRFVSPQKLTADVPGTMIVGEGPRQVIVQTPDGKLYSNQVLINVQPPPRPQFQYIGMIARKRYNNDTAYFMEQGKQIPIAARLNDVIGGRFRLVSISAEETIFEDINLGFRHPVPISKPAPGSTTASGTGPSSPNRTGFPPDATFVPYNPNMPNPIVIQPGEIPGIPGNVPRYQPPANVQRPPEKKSDDDDPEQGGQ